MCDALCALPTSTIDGVTVFAKNSDRPWDEPQDLEWHPPRVDRGPVATTYREVEPHPGETFGVLGSRPRWMWGMEHGVNEAGLAVGNEAVFTTLDPRPFPPALVGMDLVRLALERAGDAASGVDVIVDSIARYGQGGNGHQGRRPYWSSFLLADPVQAFVVETSGNDVAVEAVDAARAISNRTTILDFDAAVGYHGPGISTMVDPRLEASKAVLATPFSVERAREHLRSHAGGEDGWTICMHAEETTTAGLVVALTPEAPRIAHAVLGHPCTSIFVPVVVGQPLGPVPPWERFAALGESTVDAVAGLEAALRADVAPEPGWNAEAWRRVGALLDEVGC